MATDYVVFLHGVNTRGNIANPDYADPLIANIKAEIAQPLNLKMIPLYWGDIAQKQDEKLKVEYHQSKTWPQFWFLNFRENLLLQFVGDAVLYISRYVGSQIIAELRDELEIALEGWQTGDRLHLVSHSLGTIIIIDLLFSSRWDAPDAPALGRESALWIRNIVYGVEPNPLHGLRIASVSTMASPLGLFKLMDVDQSEQNRPDATHDVTPRLQVFLQILAQERAGKPLPWLNFAHPADPIAYPLDPLLYDMVAGQKRYLSISDHLTPTHTFLDVVLGFFKQYMIALLDFPNAHNSYWQNKEVAKLIAQTLTASAQTP